MGSLDPGSELFKGVYEKRKNSVRIFFGFGLGDPTVVSHLVVVVGLCTDDPKYF